MKPILFNTEMVQAILEGRKTVTRRPLKIMVKGVGNDMTRGVEIKHYLERAGKLPYQVGDTLYVRETWSPVYAHPMRYLYKTECPEAENLPVRWHPSIHMPTAAARIFLRVTDIRVERLQDITRQQCRAEGICECEGATNEPEYMERTRTRACQIVFYELWDSTIKKQDISTWGWHANPWVWVIEFERMGGFEC